MALIRGLGAATNAVASVGVMDTPLGRALAGVRTSNGWSLLRAVVPKVNRRLEAVHAPTVSVQDLAAFLTGLSDNELRAAGVWREGAGSAMLVCVNPAYGRAREAEAEAAAAAAVVPPLDGGADGGAAEDAGHVSSDGVGMGACTCVPRADTEAGRYFGSHDYNGGRHSSTASKHACTCPLWAPPSSGHLHSWRRKY